MLEIADEIILDPEIALVDFGDERQLIHVFKDRALAVMHDSAARVAIAQTVDPIPGAAFGDFLDREIELVAADEVDGGRGFETLARLDRDLGADESDPEAGVGVLHRLRDLHVIRKRRRRGVHHDEFMILRERQDIGESEAGRRGVDEAAPLDQRCRLCQPGRIPERADLAAGLIARAGTAIEALEGGRL